MRSLIPAASRTRQGARSWTVVVVAVLFLLCAGNASAALTGSITASGTDTPQINVVGLTTGPFTIPGSGPSFCIGPPASCNSGSGVSGTSNLSANQVSFTFFGSTNAVSGDFTINLTGFTTAITGVTLNAGSTLFSQGTFGLLGFTPSSLSFKGIATGNGFSALGGRTYIFDVTTAAAVPEPGSVVLLSTLIAGAMFVGRRRLRGSAGTGV